MNVTHAKVRDIDAIREYAQWLKGLQGEWQELRGERRVQATIAGGGNWRQGDKRKGAGNSRITGPIRPKGL